jgi:hypothetical protein
MPRLSDPPTGESRTQPRRSAQHVGSRQPLAPPERRRPKGLRHRLEDWRWAVADRFTELGDRLGGWRRRRRDGLAGPRERIEDLWWAAGDRVADRRAVRERRAYRRPAGAGGPFAALRRRTGDWPVPAWIAPAVLLAVCGFALAFALTLDRQRLSAPAGQAETATDRASAPGSDAGATGPTSEPALARVEPLPALRAPVRPRAERRAASPEPARTPAPPTGDATIPQLSEPTPPPVQPTPAPRPRAPQPDPPSRGGGGGGDGGGKPFDSSG